MRRGYLYSCVAILFCILISSADATVVRVYANTPHWINTGISIPADSWADISASGSWSINVNGSFPMWWGPEGSGIAPSSFLVPGGPYGGLVGRIDLGPGFAVGTGGRFDSLTYGSGELWLAFNDQVANNGYADNGGYVDVTIIPEPATLSLLVLGGLTMFRKRK